MPILTTAHIARPVTASSPLSGFLTASAELLAQEDPQLHGAVRAEHAEQESTLSLLADTGVVDPSVLACMAGVTRSAGQLAGDEPAAIERLAAGRARDVFKAGYANVLPSSTGAALAGVLTAAGAGEVLDLRGEPDPGTQLRGDEVAALARRSRPSVIVYGGRDAPAGIDDARLRAIADEVGAVLVADVCAVAGLVAVGLADSPVPHAHVTIVDTHAQLFGPPGAVVLTPSHDALADAIADTLTWSWPGACGLPAIAGKARALHLTGLELFRDTVRRTRTSAAQLASELAAMGHVVRGEDLANPVVLVELGERYPAADPVVRGLRAVNMTTATAPARAVPALRLGTATLAKRQFGASEVRQVAELLDSVLGATSRDGTVDEFVRLSAYDSVRRLLSQFPLPCYVPVTQWEDHR